MERSVTPTLLASFIKYAAIDRVTMLEWNRSAVTHYCNERMENARCECVRILGAQRTRPIP